jgi:hypothetical protein
MIRQILVASLLAVTAVAAMSQEIDRSETLQAKGLAAAELARNGAPAGRSRESVVAETRNLQAQGALKVGEKADGPSVDAVPSTQFAGHKAVGAKTAAAH